MQKKLKVLLIFLAILLIAILHANNVKATDEVASGKCGDNITWSLNNKGTLKISGSGYMYGYRDTSTNVTESPWAKYQSQVKEVVFDGEMLYSKKKHLHRKQQCKQIQMVFQNPEGSLNPKHTIEKILSDAMLFHKITDRAHVKEKCQEWVQRMELPEDTLSRFPSSFSGGQKQRIALARALCVSPKFLIADEPTSALDVSVQLRMLQLIKELKREMGLTILFISHDMGVIYDICDEVAVMKDGKIEETGEKEAFFAKPKTEYGKLLLDSVPTLPYLE